MTASFLDLVDLAAERLGGAVVAANDEFFAPKENLIKPGAPVWRDGVYTERGKWMDGWETRRRRDLGAGVHDWCVVRLGVPGMVKGVDVETTHFKGNFPEACGFDLANLPGVTPAEGLPRASWLEALAPAALKGDAHNLFPIEHSLPATHVRLRMYPDGGIARLRVHGDVVPDWERLWRRGEVDLAAVEHGGFVVACSDMFFGSRHNLIMPGDARHMGDGWETRRRRGPGHDWTIVRLGAPGTIARVEVDTRHFKGNAPGACSLDACVVRQDVDETALARSDWRELLPHTALAPDARQTFEDGLKPMQGVTYVRLNIYPDGGVARLRVYGRPSLAGAEPDTPGSG